MEGFNEEEVQKKIEEKRKRFIENAHRALGFYDHNMLSNPEEHKVKRNEMIEKEFNKVFDDTNNKKRRYDEEPSKPLILASSKNPENVATSYSEGKINKEISESKSPYNEKRISDPDEDSLTVAQKEMEMKTQSDISTIDATRQMSEKKTFTNALPEPRNIHREKSHQEENKGELAISSNRNVTNSKKKQKEKAKNLKQKHETYSDDEYDDDQVQNKGYNNQVATIAKNKKMKKFIVNTRHCRQERETLQYVVDL